MSNNGHDAEARAWLWLILLQVFEGLFRATIALKNWVLSKLTIDPYPFEGLLSQYFRLTLELLLAFATLAAIFKLLFVLNRKIGDKQSPSHLPWWSGR